MDIKDKREQKMAIRTKHKLSLFLLALLVFFFILIGGIFFSYLQLKKEEYDFVQKQNIILPITELSTTSYMAEGTLPPGKKTMTVSVYKIYADKIEAYGSSIYGIVGPKGWVGNLTLGTNGNIVIEIYPKNGSVKSGPNISLYEVSNCWTCILDGAAPFWEQARKELTDMKLSVPEPIPGLKTMFWGPKFVRFNLPDTSDGLKIEGVAYLNIENGKIEPPFEIMTTTLPPEQFGLAWELLNIFIKTGVPK